MDLLLDLVHWLGKLHPAVVSFPVALLVAAVVAESLLMITGRDIYNAASRFCVCGAVITAAAGAGTGWFFGGLQLTDEDWVMMTHRWLGTSVAIWSLPVWILSELGHRAGSRNIRTSFRVILFIGAALACITGYFGGALIYGLDHYRW